jgi:hypothetical protein
MNEEEKLRMIPPQLIKTPKIWHIGIWQNMMQALFQHHQGPSVEHYISKGPQTPGPVIVIRLPII